MRKLPFKEHPEVPSFLKNNFLEQDCSVMSLDEMCQVEMLDMAILFLLALRRYHLNDEGVRYSRRERRVESCAYHTATVPTHQPPLHRPLKVM